MAMRPVVRAIHLVLGLVAGLLLSVVTVSGAAVVFRPELDRLYASPATGSARSADLDSTAAALRERWPGVRVQRLLTPVAGGDADEWWLRDGKGTPEPGDDESWKAYTDPATGEPLGDTRGRLLPRALAWLALFHHNLWLGQVGGILVGTSGLCLLGFVATGLWLWWPGLSRLGSALRLRLATGGYVRNLDLHNWVGVLGTPLLIVVALTGSMFEFRWMRAAVHYGLGGGEIDRPLALRPRPPQPAQAEGRPGERRPPAEGGEERRRGPSLGFTRAIAAAEAAAPGTALAVMPPRQGRGDGPWTVYLDYPGNVGSFSGVLVQVAPDATPALVLDPRTMSPGGWVNGQLWGLHTGTWGGAWSKALYLAAGLLPPVLLVTGLAMWLHRRRAQAASARPPG